MITITQTTTKFKAPPRITAEEYHAIRTKLLHDVKFKIDSKLVTFSEHFSGELKFVRWAFIYLVLFGIIYPFLKSNNLESSFLFYILAGAATIGGFGMFFVIVFNLIMDGASYATYVKERRGYFDRMEITIKASGSYSEFVKAFYVK